MKEKHLFWIMIVASLITSCAQPLTVRHSSAAKRERAEQTLRTVETTHRTLATKNFVSHIRRHIGIPYLYGGTSSRGMDCSGFVMIVYQEAFSKSLSHSTKLLYESQVPLSAYELSLGDLVFFNTKKGGRVNHVGIYLIDSKFAHASKTSGVTISDLSESYYKTRYIGARRVANVSFD